MSNYQTDEAIFMIDDGRKMTVKACVCTDVGRVRNNNEDNYLLRDRINGDQVLSAMESDTVEEDEWTGWQCYGVFDGMGGGEKGEWASLTAASLMRDAFCVSPLLTQTRSDIDELVAETYMRINGLIVNEQSRSGVYGTTATAVCCDGAQFKVYHAGDSRAYLKRGKDLYCLTQDQTLSAMKLEMGLYEEGDPKIERDKHLLTVYLGCDDTGDKLAPQRSEWTVLEDGDMLMICSDGLYDMVSDTAISRILGEAEDPADAAGTLCDLALAAGGYDNVTCMVLAFTQDGKIPD